MKKIFIFMGLFIMYHFTIKLVLSIVFYFADKDVTFGEVFYAIPLTAFALIAGIILAVYTLDTFNDDNSSTPNYFDDPFNPTDNVSN